MPVFRKAWLGFLLFQHRLLFGLEERKWEVLLESCHHPLHRQCNQSVIEVPGLTQDKRIAVHHMQHKLLKHRLCLQALE